MSDLLLWTVNFPTLDQNIVLGYFSCFFLTMYFAFFPLCHNKKPIFLSSIIVEKDCQYCASCYDMTYYVRTQNNKFSKEKFIYYKFVNDKLHDTTLYKIRFIELYPIITGNVAYHKSVVVVLIFKCRNSYSTSGFNHVIAVSLHLRQNASSILLLSFHLFLNSNNHSNLILVVLNLQNICDCIRIICHSYKHVYSDNKLFKSQNKLC